MVRPALGGFASWCRIAVAAGALVAGSAPLARAAADESSSAQRGRAGTPSTSSEGWDLALTGGFVANGLIDPVYALGTSGMGADEPAGERVTFWHKPPGSP